MSGKSYSLLVIRRIGILGMISLSLLAFSCGGQQTAEVAPVTGAGSVAFSVKWEPLPGSSTPPGANETAIRPMAAIDICSVYGIDQVRLEVWRDGTPKSTTGVVAISACNDNSATLRNVPANTDNLYVQITCTPGNWVGETARFTLSPNEHKDLGEVTVRPNTAVASPTFSPTPGTYQTAQSVTLSTTTSGATIRYTTDGTIPSETVGTLYSGPIPVPISMTIRTVAYFPGGFASPVSTATYEITGTVAVPTFSPSPGTYTTAQTVILSTTTSGATIRYTTDGTTPTENVGTVYSGPISVSSPMTIRAVAYRSGWTTSPVTSGTYEITGTVAAPDFSPTPGTYTTPQTVTLSATPADATIRYTIDGTTPTETMGTIYTSPISVSSSMTIKAMAYKSGWSTSFVISGTYTITGTVAQPSLSPPPGTYNTAQSVALSTTTAGSTIRYTTNGTTPTETMGTIYTSPISVSSSITIKAVAYKADWVTSTVTSGDYTIFILPTYPSVAAGNYHSLWLKSDGTVWAWGENNNGQLGDGTTTIRTSPVKVLNLTDVAAVSGGALYSVALKRDGTVWAWGYNRYGALGDGTTTNRLTPVKVSGLTGVVAISSNTHVVALKSDGTVWTWGANYYGQLGDGTTIDRLTPVKVSGLANVKAISAGIWHSVAVKSDGKVWAWGHNGYGQLGDNTTTNRLTPVMVLLQWWEHAVAAGGWRTYSGNSPGFSTLYGWGQNNYGQLGDGTTTTRLEPVYIGSMIQAIAAGTYHTAIINASGNVMACGLGGLLGDGTTTSRPTFGLVSGLTGITSISAGQNHTLALKNDGTVWAWGDNQNGQLGDGTLAGRYTPVKVLQ